jgi:ribosomal protein S11
LVFKSLKDGFNVSLVEVLALKKRKFRLRRRIKKKLSFFYSLYDKKKKIFKLKTRMVNSNFFITLTDYNNKVLMYKSTGQVSENRKKKIKLSPAIVMKMMSPILYLLKKKRIKLLFICINSKINRHINNVIKCLKKNRRIRILKILFSKPIAHHFGTRKPKLRRL